MGDILDDVKAMLDTNWSAAVEEAEIIRAIDYRSIDLMNHDYVILDVIEISDSFLGMGAKEYRKDFVVNVVIKTGKSRSRAWEMLEECRRIFRTKDYWGDYLFFLMSRAVDLSERERKIFSFAFTVTCSKIETI
ncbi:MAG: hypothetical protein ACUVUF_07825 [Candidatus Bathycorpusculaceae bacterium]